MLGGTWYLPFSARSDQAAVRRAEEDSPLLPDGKSQVTVEYSDDGKPLRIDTVVISSQHRDDVTLDELRPYIIEKVCKSRKQIAPSSSSMVGMPGSYSPYPIEVVVGGATIFVLEVSQFLKV